MRYAVIRPSAIYSLVAFTLLLSGCSMDGGHAWTWDPFNRAERAERLPTIDMDFSPNSPNKTPAPSPRPTRVAARPALPSTQIGSGRAEWNVGPSARPWRYIVIHHSATDDGNAAKFHRMHLDRGWDELGYHFVIDNGDGGPDGRVEVGSRWRKQKHGAHCGGTPGNEYNEVGIGVCLVGNFQTHMPSRRQLAALQELLDYLMAKYNIPSDRVIAHRDAPGAKTACCGRVFYKHLNVALRPSLEGGVFARR